MNNETNTSLEESNSNFRAEIVQDIIKNVIGARKLKIEQAEDKWKSKLNTHQFFIVRKLQEHIKTFAPHLGLYFLPNFITWKNEETGKSDYFSFIKASRSKLSLYIKVYENLEHFEPMLTYVTCYKAVRFDFSFDQTVTEKELDFVGPILAKSFSSRLDDKKVSRSRLYE